jgi:preprotein translocase subunit SecG
MWYVAIMLTQTLYGLNLNDDDPTGFPLGPTICVAAIALVFAFLIQTEPGMYESWHGRTRYDRLVYWMAVVTIYFSFYYVVQFDFFFSSAAQTWLLWGVWILTWFVLALVHGRGKELVLILNGAFNKKKTSVQ